MDKPILGDFCHLYCDSGSSSTPVWTEWGEIDGVTCSDLTRESVELNVRTLKSKPSLAGKMGALTFGFKYYPGFNDERYAQLIDDFFGESPVRKWAMMDGDIATSGTQGLVMPAYVEGIPYNQNASEAISHDVTLKYGYLKSGSSVVEPSWMTVS